MQATILIDNLLPLDTYGTSRGDQTETSCEMRICMHDMKLYV